MTTELLDSLFILSSYAVSVALPLAAIACGDSLGVALGWVSDRLGAI